MASSSTTTTHRVKVTDILYEVQTRRSIFSHFQSPSKFLNSNQGEITPAYKNDQIEELNKQRINNNQSPWQWLTEEWLHLGSDAWQYASKWNSTSGKDESKHWSYAESFYDMIRRRKWVRSRVNTLSTNEYNELMMQCNQSKGEFTVTLIQDEHSAINNEIDAMKKQLQEKYVEINANTHKPNILLLGGSGAGKSSLVNAVFGVPLAEIGEGKPITQQYTKFSGPESPVVIYDSKGIEHGYVESGFVADTKKFFKKLRGESDLEKHVHVVWYVIDLTQARFQPFEATFCRELLKDIPIIFVLNKADAVTPQVRDIMIKVISDHQLPNAIGIYPTVANCKNYDSKNCPQCGSLKIRKRLKAGTCTIMCKECNYNQTMEKTSGISQLSRSTLSVMPDLVKEVYIVSQKSDVLGLENQAKKLIEGMAADASMTKYERTREQLQKMVQQLAQLYKMPTIAEMMAHAVVERFDIFYNEQKFTKRANLFLSDLLSKKSSYGQGFVVAAGMEVCNNIIGFKNAAIQFSIHTFEDEVKNETEQTPDNQASEQTSVEAVTSELNNTLSLSEKKKKNKDDREWFIQKQVAGMQLKLDSVMVNEVSDEIRKFGSISRYLAFIPLDGINRQYKTPDWDEIRRRRREQEEEDRKAMAIPLYTYQKTDQDASSSSTSAPPPTTSQDTTPAAVSTQETTPQPTAAATATTTTEQSS